MDYVVNHMTAPRLGWEALLELAAGLGCAGVELRNDLPTPLFSGADPGAVRAGAAARGLRIVGLSEVYGFNVFSPEVRARLADLIAQARACGAETVSLIPLNDGTLTDPAGRGAALRHALIEIAPMLDAAGLVGLVEPLGFARSSLRLKAEAVDAIEATGTRGRFALVHDTFHHFLAGEDNFFAEHTGIVHISGVTDRAVPPAQMEDEHRVLVDEGDRLGNIDQLRALRAAGYSGPVSFEAFAPAIHALGAPADALAASMAYIDAQLAGQPG